MHPTAFHLGRLAVNSYTILLDLGLLLAIGMVAWRARRRLARPSRWLEAAIVTLAAGVLGGRLAYVGANWVYYQDHRSQLLKFWRGGLNWHGALAGAMVGALVYCWLRRLDFWRLADELALAAPVVGIGGWLGCLMVGCAYGSELIGPRWLAADLPDLYGVWALRVNVQLLAAGWSLLTALLLWIQNLRSRRPGMTLAFFLAIYGLGLGFIDSWRGDSVPLWAGRRADVLLDWGFAAGGILLLVVLSLLQRWSGRRLSD